MQKDRPNEILAQYGCGPIQFTGTNDALYERHLIFDHVIDPKRADPRWHYDNEAETQAALSLIFSDYFSPNEPGVFEPLRHALLTGGDHYMHLADLRSYLDADRRLCDLYANSNAWAHKAILNIAGSARFSSDRTIAEYAADIWNVKSCPVP